MRARWRSPETCRNTTQTLFVPSPLLAKPHLLGEARARGGVVWRPHGIVAAETPLFAILLRGEVIPAAQMPFERFQSLSVLETNDVIWGDCFLYGYCRPADFARHLAIPA